MNEYSFQYTKVGDTFLVLIFCLAICLMIAFVGHYFYLSSYLFAIPDSCIFFILFQKLKRRAVYNCIAKFNDSIVKFSFEKTSRVINFNDLTYFRFYQDRGGGRLYLKNKKDSFKISANPIFCKTNDFVIFCKQLTLQLEKYKADKNPSLIHERFVYTTKRMTYFLIFGTLIYLTSFFFESKDLRIGIGIGGGGYFLFMWNMYFIEKYGTPKSQTTL